MQRSVIRAFLGLAVFSAMALSAFGQVKEHQATGTVTISGPNQVIIAKKIGRNTTKWAFVVNLKTKLETKPAKSMRVRIYYHEEKGLRIADRIRNAPEPTTNTPAISQTPPQK